MSNVLIIGNVLKDVYLRLDERMNQFEKDENDVPWLDLAFDGRSGAKFFRRSSIYGGATVALEVVSRFGLNAHIAGAKIGFVDGEIIPNDQIAMGYRYVLCFGNKTSYLTANEREKTRWTYPKEAVDWIFIDRSTGVTDELVKGLQGFLSMSNHTRLAMYLPQNPTAGDKKLLELAELVFVDGDDSMLRETDYSGSVCQISDKTITLGNISQNWRMERTDLMTHLTCYSIIAASVFSGLVQGASVKDALRMAKVNVENSTIAGTLDLDEIKEKMENSDGDETDIRMIAAQLMAAGKGILAADESGGSIHKKFEGLHIPDDAEHRRDYRNIFFSTPGLEQYINGVILFDETTKQHADDGRDFVQYLTAHGIIPGIKVDRGLVNFSGSDEKYTDGLDNLYERMVNYYERGLRFAKWRAAFEITENTPSKMAVEKNAEILAEYAKICQDANIVPIVEPEVVYDGNYTIDQCKEVTAWVLDTLFDELARHEVRLDACILKCNMILAGKKYPIQSTPAEVGLATAEVLRGHVPDQLAGVVFLSGGQTVTQATDNLRAIVENGPYPWAMTFSFARALQDPALNAWNGDNDNYDDAKKAFKERLIENCKVLAK